MSGYIWAKTPAGELFQVLIVDGKGYVPGVENAIDLDLIDAWEPAPWPTELTRRNLSSALRRSGVPAADAMPECVILRLKESA